ncbi:PD-(D/E)XK nuclease-like domain-containing protein [Sandaracinus amylolyticus]|uniref:PD-(D/E)XK nuclease-like domain-containing protein n=1 Tax=Sandaracinus amylolyticus TaxID=927083 RepID=UPI001F483BF6|nr:PD-(D/E)XK nuclease-like domain-containing protein [Sandaracinus amylolyticus]UJR81444.1 Exodeoxyribonuclease VIII [Sandaracinus amylolyticus]
MSGVDYASIDAVNWSTLVHLATSAKLLEYRRDHAREDTRALRLGTLIHCAVLEPELWATRFIVEPDFGDGRRKEAKEAKAAWRASIDPDAVIVDADEHALVSRCAEAALAHPAVRDLLRGGHAEEVLTWHDEATGIACKGRLDYVAPAYLVDLKSTRAETLEQLAREVAGRLYHGQVAFYLDGAVATRRLHPLSSQVFVVAIQTVEPFDVIPARIQVADLERGRALYRSLLRRYAECRAADWWPGLAPSVVDLPLPAWTPSGEPEQTGDDW